MSDCIPPEQQLVIWEGPGNRGLQLQCVFSKCFPDRYVESKSPCTTTKFADFRELLDHIWKYHSSRLSCENCDHRFYSASRTQEKAQSHGTKKNNLRQLKAAHDEDCPKNKVKNPDIYDRNTMTKDQDDRLDNWKSEGHRNKKVWDSSVPPLYKGLCRQLFGPAVKLPENPRYNYLLVNQDELTAMSVNRQYPNGPIYDAYQQGPSSSSEVGMTRSIPPPAADAADPLLLDGTTRFQPIEATLPRNKATADSGYYSNESAAAPPVPQPESRARGVLAGASAAFGSYEQLMDPSYLIDLSYESPFNNAANAMYPCPLHIDDHHLLGQDTPEPENSSGPESSRSNFYSGYPY